MELAWVILEGLVLCQDELYAEVMARCWVWDVHAVGKATSLETFACRTIGGTPMPTWPLRLINPSILVSFSAQLSHFLTALFEGGGWLLVLIQRRRIDPLPCCAWVWFLAEVPLLPKRRVGSPLVGVHGLPCGQGYLGDEYIPLTSIPLLDGVGARVNQWVQVKVLLRHGLRSVGG